MMSDDLCFEQIDWKKISNVSESQNLDVKTDKNTSVQYDDTTTETYRIRRLFKIDPLTDLEVREEIAFRFYNMWNPYSGVISGIDPIGPLYFNAINLYNYYFLNRYKGLWVPPQDQFQGYYGDAVGTGKKIKEVLPVLISLIDNKKEKDGVALLRFPVHLTLPGMLTWQFSPVVGNPDLRRCRYRLARAP